MRCESSGVLVPKDKAIKRFIVRNIVDASAIRDIQDSSVIDGVSISPHPLPFSGTLPRRHTSCYTSNDQALCLGATVS